MSRNRVWWALVSWTVVLWLSRLRNVFADDGLSTAGRLWRVGVVVVFVGLAGLTARHLVTRSRDPRRPRRGFPTVLVVWTIAFWLVRGTGILLDDHPVGFEVVHTLLAVVSLVLAVGAQRAGAPGASRRDELARR